MAAAELERPPCTGPPDAPSSRSQAPPRIHYLDNLRAVAMLLGVFLHGAFAYAQPANLLWLATDSSASSTIDAAIWFIHLFRMSLFFLIAGYFAKLTVQRAGVGRFLTNRLARIVVPLVVAWPVLAAAMMVSITFALKYVPEPRGLLGLIKQASRELKPEAEAPWPGAMHLWFLYYLAMFTLVAGCGAWLRWPNWQWLDRRPRLWLLFPLLLLPSVLAAGFPLPAPESFVPQAWPFAFYGLFYWAGWRLVGHEHRLAGLQSWSWLVLAVSLLLFIPYYVVLPVMDLNLLQGNSPPMRDSSYLLGSSLTCALTVLLTLASLLVGQRFLAQQNAYLKFIADSSYWVYLVHLPVVVFLQTLLVPVPCNLWLKLVIVLAGAWLFATATYLVFVRYTPIGWLLHGKRKFP